jgi:hypothetical protein
MFAAVLDFLFFLFVTFFLIPALVVLAHAMRSWALADRRADGVDPPQQPGIGSSRDSGRDYSGPA